MSKKYYDLKQKHLQKLMDLFKGRLSISDKSYYQLLKPLDNTIMHFKEEVLENCIDLTPHRIKVYYDFLYHKLFGIPIEFNQQILEQKLTKYQEDRNDFPCFSNPTLIEQLSTVPTSVPVSSLSPESLSQQSLLLILQKTFYRYWMGQKKEEVLQWLQTLLEEFSAERKVEQGKRSESFSLNQIIIFLDKTGALALWEDDFLTDLPKVLERVTGRPPNKIVEKLKELNIKSRERNPLSQNVKDEKIVDEFIGKYSKGIRKSKFKALRRPGEK